MRYVCSVSLNTCCNPLLSLSSGVLYVLSGRPELEVHSVRAGLDDLGMLFLALRCGACALHSVSGGLACLKVSVSP